MATSCKSTLLRMLVLTLLATGCVPCVHGRMISHVQASHDMKIQYDVEARDAHVDVEMQVFNVSEAHWKPDVDDWRAFYNTGAGRFGVASAVDENRQLLEVQDSTDVDTKAFAGSRAHKPWNVDDRRAVYDSGGGVGVDEKLDATSESPSSSAQKNRHLLEAQDRAHKPWHVDDWRALYNNGGGFSVAAVADGTESPSSSVQTNRHLPEVQDSTEEGSEEGNKNDEVLSAGTVYDVEATAGSLNGTLVGCGTGNPIDDCWRCNPNWRSHRQSLASCAVGFGSNAVGGKNGPIYVVTSNADDAENPKEGTLRHAVTLEGPQWIIFEGSMTIKLKGELWVSAHKTIDARGTEVHITGANQISVQSTNNVIIHGLHIQDVRKSDTQTTIRVSPDETKHAKNDGDAIRVWDSHDVWIDHCYLANAYDGLIDVTQGSTRVTISNCVLEDQDKVMLLGANGDHDEDKGMRVTVAFNRFGSGLVQRMPRCRLGVFHVVNNDYSSGWGLYAIGGSQNPTILSQGNLFNAKGEHKEVTMRIDDDGPSMDGWEKWNWVSSGDVFQNGAYFTGSGADATSSVYAQASSMPARPGDQVPTLTINAGPIKL